MELWDVYDRERKLTGKTHKRGASFAEGEYHLVVHMAIFTRDGRMLIQKRAATKSTWPSMWDISAGGAVLAGESSAEGAHRELLEELGIDYDFTKHRPHLTLSHNLAFSDIYIIEMDVDINTLSLQPSEVCDVKLATVNEIIEMMDNGSFIPYHNSFIQLLFDMRAGYGVHSHIRNR